ncbi:MAG: Flp family type IVb pilin [Bryobacterales bacterium]|nr:Flp family type IVb pilin [Bryobacteraceae bacterium]MDW8353824.1 Flp family type IVb pilin [Bryobacterales bacterium]
MRRFWTNAARWGFWQEDGGQDLVEYALLAGFVAVAGAAAFPPAAQSISSIFSRVQSVLSQAGA